MSGSVRAVSPGANFRIGAHLDQAFLEPVFKRWARQVPLSDQDRQAMSSLPWSLRTYARDSYLVREGEPTTICTLLISGFAYRQKLVSDGRRQIISFHIPGEFLDIQNCLLDVADHNVQALSRAIVAAIPKGALVDLMGSRVNVRRALWLDSLIDSSIFREWVVNLGRRDAMGRIAHLLCEFADRLRASGMDDGQAYDFPMTQEQIADATGLTAVHTNRMLQDLRKKGVISLTASRLQILDWDRLVQIGDFSERYLHHSVSSAQ
jgi:CRP-like cAMP-binding protein